MKTAIPNHDDDDIVGCFCFWPSWRVVLFLSVKAVAAAAACNKAYFARGADHDVDDDD